MTVTPRISSIPPPFTGEVPAGRRGAFALAAPSDCFAAPSPASGGGLTRINGAPA